MRVLCAGLSNLVFPGFLLAYAQVTGTISFEVCMRVLLVISLTMVVGKLKVEGVRTLPKLPRGRTTRAAGFFVAAVSHDHQSMHKLTV